ncbi:MAG: hypothetical protein E2P03_03920 [Acidobacteria bacterium]|nr:MAG: hypothetical protein E2P03_03920 [Acidobacteriota bacterium]
MSSSSDSTAGSASLLPDGLTTFDLPLGKLRIRVIDLPTTWIPFVEENYAPFAEAPSDDVTPDLAVQCTTGHGLLVPLPSPGEVPVIELEDEGSGAYRIRSHWQDGVINVATGKGSVTFTSLEPIHLRMSLENFLRIACQLLLPARGSFLMHSAGVIDQGRCFLFFGQSGAGKSLATELSLPRRILSDDMVLVDADATPATIHAVPFFGAFPMEQRTRGAFPLAAALRLRQSEDTRIEPLRAGRAVATVSASIPFVHDLGLRHEGLLDLVTRFCNKVPVADLHFTRSDRFWSVLRDHYPA